MTRNYNVYVVKLELERHALALISARRKPGRWVRRRLEVRITVSWRAPGGDERAELAHARQSVCNSTLFAHPRACVFSRKGGRSLPAGGSERRGGRRVVFVRAS